MDSFIQMSLCVLRAKLEAVAALIVVGGGKYIWRASLPLVVAEQPRQVILLLEEEQPTHQIDQVHYVEA